MTDFLTADTNLPSYMMFPRFLLDMEINETAKMLYIILLDRARLSQKNEGWSDIDGHVFIYFTIEALAEVLHKTIPSGAVHAVIDGDKANTTLTQDFHNLTDFQIVTTHAAHVLDTQVLHIPGFHFFHHC